MSLKNMGFYVVFFCFFSIFLFKANAYDLRDRNLLFRAGISKVYDDNITFVKTNKKSDFITNLTLGVGAKYEGSSRKVEAAGNIRQQIFSKNSNFNNTSESLEFDFEEELSKYSRISLNDAFTHAEEPRSFEDAFGRSGGRYSHDRNKFNLDLAQDITKQLGMAVMYANEIYNVSRKDLSDSQLNSMGFSANYSPNSRSVISGGYTFSKREFVPGKSADTHTISSGLKQNITEKSYLEIKTGLDFINSFNDTDYTKPNFAISFFDEIDKRTTVAVSFEKKFYTNSYTEDVFNYWQFTGDFRRQLLEKLGVFVSGFYAGGKYIGLNISDNFQGANTGLVYDFKDNLKGSLTYSYSNLNSNDSSRGYEKNVAIAGITAEF